MVQRILVAVAVVMVVCMPLSGADPKQDLNDNEGRAKIMSAVKVPSQLLDGYQKWPMLTAGAVDTSERQYFVCGADFGGGREKLEKSQGPHFAPAIRVYANAQAKAAIDGKTGAFPPGSILVKEKLSHNKISAITAMIRERDDYDWSDDKQNWRYFYVDRRQEMQFGRIKNCRECHQNASATDFAFLKYPDDSGDSSGP